MPTPTLDLEFTKNERPLQKWISEVSGMADYVGIRKVRELTQTRGARDGRIDDNSIFWDEGLMVEVIIGQQIAYAGTADFSSLGVQKAVQKAVALAKAGKNLSVFTSTEGLRPKAHGQYRSPVQKSLNTKSLQDFYQQLIQATKTMKISDQIVSSSASVNFVETEFEYVNTNGSHTLQNFLMISSHFGVTAQDGTESVSRGLQGPRGLCVQSGLEIFDQFGLEKDLNQVAEEALLLLKAPPCPSKTCDLILMPNQMLIQIHESIGHPLELDRILGDERNFAGWSFVQAQDFGQLQYGSNLMNVTFDPTYQGEFASYSFDDCGNEAKKEYLIKDGKLLRGLGSLESQKRSGIPGVANFRAMSWYRPPIDRMANINLEPGKTTLKEMIAQVEDGILMDSNISWSIDDYRNKFQFGCEMGRIIKDGELKGIVKQSNYRGITVPFWRGLKAVGTQDETAHFGSPFCGKGEPSQIIRVGHASPPCLFSNVEVFGGGK